MDPQDPTTVFSRLTRQDYYGDQTVNRSMLEAVEDPLKLLDDVRAANKKQAEDALKQVAGINVKKGKTKVAAKRKQPGRKPAPPAPVV